MKSYSIIGCGYFGSKAVRKILKLHPKAQITVVDKDPKSFVEINKLSIESIALDGVSYLNEILTGSNDPDWIVPAVPIHLAFEWIFTKLQNQFFVERLSVPLDLSLPNSFRGEEGSLYCSIADFRCPDDCYENPKMCKVTAKIRVNSIFEVLEKICISSYVSLVVRSYQLAAGVGGYKPKILWEMLEKIKKFTIPILFSTASRCHGVTNCLIILSPR